MAITTQQKVQGIATSAGPAAVVFGDKYLLAWKGEGNDPGLYWCTSPTTTNGAQLNAYAWTPQQRISNVGTSAGPALACFNGRAYMAWKGQGSDPGIYFSALDNPSSKWAAQTRVPGVGTSHAPALAATRDALFMAWKGEGTDERLFWSKTTDGKNWSPQQVVPGAGGTSNAPALAAYDRSVYLAWKGESGDSRLFWSECTDGSSWKPQNQVGGTGGTSSGPALATSPTGNLHLAWKAMPGDNRIFTDTILPHASAQTWIPIITTEDRPALASPPAGSPAPILLAWKGQDGATIWAGPLDSLAAQPNPDAQPDMLLFHVPDTGFGSGPNNANFSAGLTVWENGNYMFAGKYQDTGSVPVFDAPAQDYSVVAALVTCDQKVFAFTHSHDNVPTGGAYDAWGTSQWLATQGLHVPPDSQTVVPVTKDQRIADNWKQITAQHYCYFKCSNSTDLGSLFDEIKNDIATLWNWAQDAMEVFAIFTG